MSISAKNRIAIPNKFDHFYCIMTAKKSAKKCAACLEFSIFSFVVVLVGRTR